MTRTCKGFAAENARNFALATRPHSHASHPGARSQRTAQTAPRHSVPSPPPTARQLPGARATHIRDSARGGRHGRQRRGAQRSPPRPRPVYDTLLHQDPRPVPPRPQRGRWQPPPRGDQGRGRSFTLWSVVGARCVARVPSAFRSGSSRAAMAPTATIRLALSSEARRAPCDRSYSASHAGLHRLGVRERGVVLRLAPARFLRGFGHFDQSARALKPPDVPVAMPDERPVG